MYRLQTLDFFFSTVNISALKNSPDLAVQGESTLWSVKGNTSTSFRVCSQTFTDYVTPFLFILSPREFLSPPGDGKHNISGTNSRCLLCADVFYMKLLFALSRGYNSSGWSYISDALLLVTRFRKHFTKYQWAMMKNSLTERLGTIFLTVAAAAAAFWFTYLSAALYFLLHVEQISNLFTEVVSNIHGTIYETWWQS